MAQAKEVPESLREITVGQLLEGDEAAGLTEDDEDIVGDPENEADEFANLSDVLVKIGDTDTEAKVMIHRMPSNGEKSSAFIAEFTVSHFATLGLPFMQKKFGAGEYQLRVYGKRPAKRRDGSMYKKTVLLKRQQVTIEKPIDIEPVAQQPAADMTMFAAILAKMEEGNRQSQALMMEGFKQMIQVQSINPASSRMTMLEEIRAMRDLFAPAVQTAPAPLAAVDPIDQVSKVLALTEQLRGAVGGGEPKEASLMDLGRELLGVVASGALKQPQQQQPARVQRAAPPVIPPPQQQQQPGGVASVNGRMKFHEAAGWVNGAPESQPQQSMEDSNVKIAQALRRIAMPNRLDDATIAKYIGNASMMLEKAADNGSDPAAYAVTICDMLGDDIVERILQRPDWRQEILTANPEMANHAAWLDSLAEELAYILHGGEEGGNTGASQQGAPDVPPFNGNDG